MRVEQIKNAAEIRDSGLYSWTLGMGYADADDDCSVGVAQMVKHHALPRIEHAGTRAELIAQIEDWGEWTTHITKIGKDNWWGKVNRLDEHGNLHGMFDVDGYASRGEAEVAAILWCTREALKRKKRKQINKDEEQTSNNLIILNNGEKKMNINDLTIAQAKELANLFGPTTAQEDLSCWPIGQGIFIRTVTHHIVGELVAVTPTELWLVDASWIADDGRFSECLATGQVNECEPFPDGAMIPVGRGALIDACPWPHALPRKVK